MKIEFSPPHITQQEIDAVVDTLKSGWITTGPKTKRFETELAAYCGVHRAACVNSATAAMELILRLFEIGPGDEVITSAYTYSASAAVIEHVGAKIVLIDTQPDSYEMDYEQLAAAMGERTKAIIPVDIAGAMSDYGRVLRIARDHAARFRPKGRMQQALGRVLVLADAAHSFGSSRDAIKSGAYADFSAFSFHAVKNLTTAEGGAITWLPVEGVGDDEIYKQLMLLSLHGQSKDALAKINNPGSWEYDILLPAYKCNMPDLQAALGLAQLARFPEMMQRRAQIIEIYNRVLGGADLQILPHFGVGFRSNMHLYLVRVNGADESLRNRIITQMAQRGVATNVHFKPLPLMTAYKNLGFRIEDYPKAYRQYQNEITLPLHTLLTDEDAVFVAETFLAALEDARR